MLMLFVLFFYQTELSHLYYGHFSEASGDAHNFIAYLNVAEGGEYP